MYKVFALSYVLGGPRSGLEVEASLTTVLVTTLYTSFTRTDVSIEALEGTSGGERDNAHCY